MAESALALREHPQIIELLSVLEQNNLSQQKEEEIGRASCRERV